MATGNFWDKFSRWRRHRPFWGGLFLLLAALELLYTANMNLGDVQIHLGPQGFLSYLLPLLLIIAGVLCWFTPGQRMFYGIIGLLTALYSFIGLNLGGFFLGMLLGIVGGALVIAWGPPREAPGQETGLPPDGEPIGTEGDPSGFTEQHGTGYGYGPAEDIETTRPIIAGHDDRPRSEYLRPAAHPGIVPGFDDQELPKSVAAKLGRNPKALTVGLIVVGVSATMLVAGSRIQASAAECPSGLPSRTTLATATGTTATATTATAAAAAAKATATKTAATATTTATPSPSASTGSGNAIVDGINSVIDGVGNLLGLGDDASASPSTSPSSSESATAEPTATATETTAPATTTDPATTTEPTKTATTTAAASASTSDSSDDIPCLGARVQGLIASNDDVPLVSAKAGLMVTDSLTMYDSTYDGVAELPTKSGTTIRSLKFSMSSAVNTPFSLTIDEPGGGQTIIKSDELKVSSNVKFYTSRFEGKLFGLIPVVFTPDSPPPLTLPVLWFTDVKIQLNLIRCDTLTGKPLKINETS